MKFITLNALALTLLLPLTGCNQAQQVDAVPRAADSAPQAVGNADEKSSLSGISTHIQKAMEKAKQELATSNIDVNNVHVGRSHKDRHSGPKAEITPQGDFLIAGKKIAATPAQQELLLGYRKQIFGIAETGMDIGTQGADLGIQASKAAIWGALSGKSDKDIEATIKPQTDKIEAAALQLCKRLPALLSSQQKLAAAMPEFRPYATMEQKDVDDCGEEMTAKGGKKGLAAFSD